MQDRKPKIPPVYVELVDAIVVHETDKAWKFKFGSVTPWIPKSVSKVIDVRLFVLQRVVFQKMHDWHGVFIEGTRDTKMEAGDDTPIDVLEAAAKAMQYQLDNMMRAIKEYRDTHKQDDEDS